ncbi:MAG: NUDIX hydrolase [Jejuia sp.]
MDEYIDIATKDGKLTGEKELKSVIHKKGLYHHTVHLWLYTKTNHVLLAQRAKEKLICPLLWDVSVAGHIDAGETAEEATIRETHEEIGLTLMQKDLKKIGVFQCFQSYDNGITDNEFHNTFIAELKVPLSNLIPQKGEVEALKLIMLSEFENLINNIGTDNHLVPSNKTYYQKVLSAITQD